MTLSAEEQLMLELVNRARLDPLAEAARLNIGLNDGITDPNKMISSNAKQVLAPNALLEQAATDHSLWQLATDTFDHIGVGGSSPGDRMAAAGYTFTGSWTWGENIAWTGTTGTIDPESAIVGQHDGLFLSAGHRVNILKDTFREIGIGQEIGDFTYKGVTYEASMVTQNFAKSGSNVFLTGVAYSDSDADDFYSVGEGVANVSYAIGGTTAMTAVAGGYALATTAATAASVTVTQGGSVSVVEADLSGGNVKLDLVDGALFRTSGDLTLISGVADAELLGTDDLSLTGNALANVLTGNKGDNTINAGGGDDTVLDGIGDDTVDLGAGNDTVVAGGGADTFTGGAGGDTVSYFHSLGAVSVDLLSNAVSGGAAGNDMISGFESVDGSSAGSDTLRGTDGANTLRGYGGNDTLEDRGGNDLVEAGDGNDYVIAGAGADTISGGAGVDYLSYVYAGVGVSVDLLAGTGSGGWAAGDVISGFEQVAGSWSYNDALRGDNGANLLRGYGGNDTFEGRGGNDLIDAGGGNDYVIAGAGADTISGGAGVDYLSYVYSSAGVNVDLQAGTGSGGYAAGDVISGVEQLAGSWSYNDALRGDNGANLLRGYGGNDTFEGRGGNDLIDAGGGNDYVIAGAGADTISGGAGVDYLSYVYSSAGVNVDLQAGTGSGGYAAGDVISGVEQLAGSWSYNDALRGDNGANLLRGYGGNDTLEGRGGNDLIDAGGGNDYVIAGAGADTISGGNGVDYLSYVYSTAGVNVDLQAGTGSGGYAAGDVISGVEQLAGSWSYNDALRGDNGANILRGYGGNDTLEGRGGNDLIDAGGGNDYVIAGAGADTISGGNGVDYLSYVYSSAGVNVDLQAGTGSGGYAAGDVISGVEQLAGSWSHDDVLSGDNGANLLRGYGGSDTLEGRGGADTLEGGAGADHFVFADGYGTDLVSDFSAGNGDRLTLSDQLWAGVLSTSEIVSTYASVIGGDVIFDFGGGDTLTLAGLTTTTALDAQIDII